MTIHQSCFRLHRPFFGLDAHLLLEGHTDFVPKETVNLCADVLGRIVSPCLL